MSKTWDVCKNCGGQRGLHHYQTDQCPVGGREAPIGQKQEWKSTTFEIEDQDQEDQKSEIEKLREALKTISELSAAEQGDWHGVQVPYAPAWVSCYREIEDVANEALGGQS